MAPPKIGVPIQTTRKTRSIVKVPHKTTEVEQETAHREEFVNVDVIPSPRVEPTSPTLVEEETQAPTTPSMEIDPHNGAHGHKIDKTDNLQQPARTEEAERTNGEANAHIEVATPRPQPEARFVQQHEGLVEDMTEQPDSGVEHRQAEVGTSRVLVRRKGKNPMERSLRKQLDKNIILSLIQEGVQATPTLLGCMEKLKDLDHDVADARKFPKFAQ
jgi:hypothetical protein